MIQKLSAAELKTQQAERERANQEAQRLAREEQERRYREAEHAALLASVEKLKNSWYSSVEAASRRDGVRFVVLAEVIDGFQLAPVQELIQSIRQDGYECELSRVSFPQRHPGIPVPSENDRETEATSGKLKGWKPGNLPRLGTSGTITHLIVKWG